MSDPMLVRRLHPSSVLFAGWTVLKELLPALVVLLFAGASRDEQFFGWVMVAGAVFYAGVVLIKVFSLRYEVHASELLIREGLIWRKVRRLPFDRIQNLAVIRGPVHRLLGVVSVRVESASGAGADGMLDVIRRDRLEELQSLVQAGIDESAEQGEGQEPRTRELLRVPTSELVRLGLISNRGMVVVAAVIGAVFQYTDDLLKPLWGMGERLLEPLIGRLDQTLPGPMVGLTVAIQVLIAALTLLRMLSILLAVLRFHGFLLERDGDRLIAHYGLLTRVTAAAPRTRIQKLQIDESLLHRAFGRVSILVQTATMAALNQQSTQLRWLAPVLPTDRAQELVDETMPDCRLQRDDWQSLASETTRWLLLRNALMWTPLLVIGTFVGLRAFLIMLALLPLVLIYSRAALRGWFAFSAWSLGDNYVLFRSGWLNRKLELAPIERIQSLAISQSPLERWAGVSTVTLDLAGGSGMDHATIRIPYMHREVAEQMLQRIGVRIDSREAWLEQPA